VADEVHQFTCTIPAGTPKSAPVTIEMPLNLYEVTSIDLDVPPGPAYLMGFYLALSGQQWLPWEMGEWIVRDNWSKSYSLTNQPTSEGWQLVGYNTGAFDHSVAVGFHLAVVGAPAAPASPRLIIISQPLAGSTSIL